MNSSSCVHIPSPIDLGLPSGTCWADCNLGAFQPGEIGNEFRWGEIVSQANPLLSSYHCLSNLPGKISTIKKILSCDPKCKKYSDSEDLINQMVTERLGKFDLVNALEPFSDAATANLGPSWRTPTKEEMNELIESCDWKFFSSNEPEKTGWLVEGPNGNTIFLPLANTYCDYWTSSVYFPDVNASWLLHIDSKRIYLWGYDRDSRRSIRPVWNASGQANPE